MKQWPLTVEKALRAALAAERQAIGIYESQVKQFQKRKRVDCQIYEEILKEEKQHRSELEDALEEAEASVLDKVAGHSFGLFLSLLPKRWNYHMHVWAEREAAKAYFLAWKELKNISGAELSKSDFSKLKQTLWHQTKQELSHRRRFQLALKGK